MKEDFDLYNQVRENGMRLMKSWDGETIGRLFAPLRHSLLKVRRHQSSKTGHLASCPAGAS